MPPKKTALFFTTLIACAFAYAPVIFAQGSLNDLKPGTVFTGPEQTFVVSLPQTTVTQQLSAKDLGVDGVGLQWRWSFPEAFITLTMLSLKNTGIKTEQDYIDYAAGVKDAVLSATKGTLITSAPIGTGKVRGLSLNVALPDGSKAMARAFPMEFMGEHLQFTLIAFVKNKEPETEKAVAAIVESFKVLTDEDRAADKAQRIAAATAILPQSPSISRPKSDAADAALKGRVKTVTHETEYTDPRYPTPIRMKDDEALYNKEGYLLSQTSFTYRGDPNEVKVFGYLDGARVSKSGHIRYEYDPPMMPTPKPLTGRTPPKPDERYTSKYAFSYDEHGRLTELLRYGNGGGDPYKNTYIYDDDKIEVSTFYSSGKLVRKEILTVDKEGRLLSKTIVIADGRSFNSSTIYKYQAFDKKGNWTERISEGSETTANGAERKLAAVEYRIITYY
jgi:hypothetical protein